MIRAILRALRMLPAALELAHLKWARAEMCPLHRDLPIVLRRIRILEDRFQ